MFAANNRSSNNGKSIRHAGGVHDAIRESNSFNTTVLAKHSTPFVALVPMSTKSKFKNRLILCSDSANVARALFNPAPGINPMLTGNDPLLIPMVMEWYNDGMIDNNGDILDFQGVLDDFGLSTVLKPDSKAVEYALRGLNSGGNPIVIVCSVNTSDMGTPLNTPPRDNNGVIGTPPNGPRTRPQRPTVIQRQPSLSSVPEVLNAPQTIDASSTPTGTQDEFDVMDRSTLQGLAKDGKLSKYGVNGRSSSDDIRDALRLQKIDNGSPSPQSSSSSSPAQTPPAPQTPER